MSYHIDEKIDNLNTALAACKLIQEFDPEASQRPLGPLHIWVSDKVSVEDCTDFKIVVDEGNGATFVPFKLLAEGTAIYPARYFNHSDYTLLRFLREKKPELFQQLLKAIQELS